jgi:ubiquinol-cytochrome c reductase cytochrome b subunit
MRRALARLRNWIDARFPLTELWNEHLAQYYAPKNFNFWYFFGSLALVVLVLQIVTGVFLTMNYTPNSELAFGSIESIMRDVRWGWLIRFMHATGASAFFIIIYLHMFRGLIYGSFKRPRELIWLVGMSIYVMLMAEAFMGYLLPWGQMSYWGAEVITSLFGTIPYVGNALETWLRGDFNVTNVTLNRFFAFHVALIPLLLVGLVFVHILALHHVGSNNPDGIEIEDNKDERGAPLDGVPFHPYYTVKDTFGIGVFLLLFALVVFFKPDFWGWFLEHDNYVPADVLKTPTEIRPLWYFLPFYAILRSFPNKLLGVLGLASSIIVLFFLPWIDRHPIKSHRYRGRLFQLALVVFAATVIFLTYLGAQAPTPYHADLGFRFTELYFSFFVLLVIYRRQRTARFYIGTLTIMGALIFMLDWLRASQMPLSLMLTSWWMPALWWAVFMLLPIFTKLNEPRAVPQRVT